MTLIGPLTTTFTAPSSCSSDIALTEIQNGGIYQGPRAPECFPKDFATDTIHWYSPGVCPHGYTVACQSQNTIGSLTETVQTCCPNAGDWQCQTEAWLAHQSTQGCSSNFPEPTVIPTLVSIQFDDSNPLTKTALSVTEAGGGGNAYAVIVRFQSTDFTTSSHTASSTADSQSSASTTNPSGETSSPSPAAGSDSGGSSLSGGAIAGIVIGSVAGLAILAAAAFFLLRRRSKKPAATGPTQYSHEMPGNQPDQAMLQHHEMSGGWYDPKYKPEPHRELHELAP